MKTMSVAKVLLPAIVLAVSVSTFAKNPHKPKKEILHYFAQDQMVSSGIISNASGQVSIHVNSVSKGKPQELQLHIGHLDINATCELQALIDGDTNLTQVAEFTTDGNGNARLEFREKNVGNGHPHGQQSLPAA